MHACSPAACAARFQKGHGPVVGRNPGVGDPCIRLAFQIYIYIEAGEEHQKCSFLSSFPLSLPLPSTLSLFSSHISPSLSFSLYSFCTVPSFLYTSFPLSNSYYFSIYCACGSLQGKSHWETNRKLQFQDQWSS